MAPTPTQNVIFFDGYCGVCDAVVSMLIPWATTAPFLFAPLQGSTYAQVSARHPELNGVDSLVFVQNIGTSDEQVSVRGNAALGILGYLGGAWLLLRLLLRVMPRAMRDWGYDIFARYRNHLAQRRDTCRLPTMAERKLFLP